MPSGRPDAEPRAVPAVLREAWPVVVVVCAALTALAHVVTTGWATLLLDNGDSLVLALVEQSAARGEPFQWVFSSQVFLFPEAVFFAASTALTDNPRVAFATNATLNLLALYALLRAVAPHLAVGAPGRAVEAAAALGATLLFVAFILLEPSASPNRSGLATPFLFTTYYYGVQLAGLGAVALTLWGTRAFADRALERRRAWGLAGGLLALTGLVAFSNPLYVLQVVAPLWLTLLALVFVDRVRWATLGVVVASTGAGLAVVAVLRRIYHGLFAKSVSDYVSLDQVPASVRVLGEAVREAWGTSPGAAKVAIVGALLAGTYALWLRAVYAQSRPEQAARIPTAHVFVVTFVTVATASLVGGHVATGSTTTRYLAPLFTWPLLTFLMLAIPTLRAVVDRLPRGAPLLAAAATLPVVVTGLAGLRGPVWAALHQDYARAACLEAFLGRSHANGVGSFWTTRPMQVYGHHAGKIVQVTNALDVQAWMINLGSYRGTFSYVVVDPKGAPTREAVLGKLGEPRAIVACDGYDIYDYAGTAGQRTLTGHIRKSRLQQLESRGYLAPRRAD